MEKVFKKVLNKIIPTSKERTDLSDVLKNVINATESVIGPLGLTKTVAGSFIRDTWLADKKEVDLFILFPVTYSRERLEKVGLDVGKKIMKRVKGKHEIAYAEHPYVKGKIREFSIDIVPCYKVKSAANIKSAVDRTPFHNRYITSNLKPRMSDDVRLLKQLCKATDIYGSDVKTMGFSGYLCELLIINYKTFKSLINNAKKWKTGTFIDIENRFDLDDPKSFFEKQPLIVIDPTDPRRNVSAALSVENFAKFVNVCSDFSKSPSEKMFEIDRRNISRKTFNNYMKKRGTQMFAVKFNRPNVVDDVLWSQMRRTTSRLVTLANEYEFKVFSNSVWSDEKQSILLLEMKTWNLSETQRLIGPPVASKKHADEFINKYGRKNIYTEGDKWAVTVKRKYRDFDKLLKDFLSRSNKKLLDDGIRSHIAKSMHKKFNVMKNDDIAKFIDNTSFSIFLRKYFERRA